MAKNNLISGSIWDEYSNQVVNRMNKPLHQGEITEEEASNLGFKLVIADFGAESCGDAVRLYWLINPSNDTIIKSKFKSFGCGTAIASSDVMAELCIGKTVDDAIKITNIDVEKALRDEPSTPAVPPQKMHCSVMAYDVIKKAVSLYKGVDMESLEEEEIICECARVSLSTIKEVIKINNLTTIEEITDYTKAGAFCKSCVKPGGHEVKDIYLVDILENTINDNNNFSTIVSEQNFNDLTIVQQIKEVEEVLDTDIRPMLAMDGGNVELIDIKQEGIKIYIYVRYLGACSGCHSGEQTLFFIEQKLKQILSEDIELVSR